MCEYILKCDLKKDKTGLHGYERMVLGFKSIYALQLQFRIIIGTSNYIYRNKDMYN